MSSFSSPGFYYRPASLKSMTVLVGNTEKRVVYKNFELNNLHQNSPDFSHTTYEYYLENNYFIPPPSSSSSSSGGSGGDSGSEGRKYWAHAISNLLPTAVSTTTDKGLFNVFPLDLLALDAKNTTASSLGKNYPPQHQKGLTIFPPYRSTCVFFLCFFRRDFNQPSQTGVGI